MTRTVVNSYAVEDFVYLGFSSHSSIFHSFGDVNITGEGLQILTYIVSSAPMAIEQRGFFGVPHLLWHGASVYNVHLLGPVTLTPIAESWAVELLPSIFTTKVCRGWDSNIQSSACRTNALNHLYIIFRVHLLSDCSVYVLDKVSHDNAYSFKHFQVVVNINDVYKVSYYNKIFQIKWILYLFYIFLTKY